MTRAAGVLAALLAAACATREPEAVPLAACDADPAVRDYVARAAERTSAAMGFHSLARHEHATLSLRFGADGSVRDFAVQNASSPEAAAVGERALRAAAPFPPPPDQQRDCLVGSRSVVQIFSLGPVCDDALTQRYTEEIARRVAAELWDPASTRTATEGITLRLQLDADGALEDAIPGRRASAEAGAKATAGARRLSPFPAPDPAIGPCIADRPFWIWLEVQVSDPPA